MFGTVSVRRFSTWEPVRRFGNQRCHQRNRCLVGSLIAGKILGYPPDARVLIVNFDDFGGAAQRLDFLTSPRVREIVITDYRAVQHVRTRINLPS